MRNTILSIAIVSGLMFCTSGVAQTTVSKRNSVSRLEKEYHDRTAFGVDSHNTSLLPVAQRMEYSQIGVGFTGANGDFHRPQQPQTSQLYNFTADGAIDMNGYYLKGAFTFGEAYEDDVKFNSIMNPYRGTPYIIADTTGGDWKKQLYNMWFGISTPYYWQRVSLGLRAGLDVGRGAKMIDPRPQSNYNEITVYPSATFNFGRHSIGADLSYRRFMENSNIILYTPSESQKMYLLKGMGQYIYDIFSTTERERRYAGDGFGWDCQYLLTGSKVKLLIGGGYENYTESASDIESGRPRQRGRLYEDRYKANAEVSVSGLSVVHLFKAAYENTRRSGREIIQIFDSSSGVNAWVTDSEAPQRSVVEISTGKAAYDLIVLNDEKSAEKWNFEVKGEYTDYSDRYDVMNSFTEYKSVSANVSAMRNISVNDNDILQLKLQGGIHRTWDNGLNLVERELDDHTIARGLVYPDARYLFSDYSKGSFAMTWQHRFANSSSISVCGNYGRINADGGWGRNTYSVWINYNF